jgi:hypothetical protein
MRAKQIWLPAERLSSALSSDVVDLCRLAMTVTFLDKPGWLADAKIKTCLSHQMKKQSTG